MIVKWRGIAWAPTRAETALWEAQAKGALSTINGCWPRVSSTQRAFSVNLTTARSISSRGGSVHQ